MSDDLTERALEFPLLVDSRSVADSPNGWSQQVTVLFDQLHAPLLRYLRTLGLSPQDGEEVLQETFLALFRHLRAGRPGENLRGWVFRVAHNHGLKRRMARPGSLESPQTLERRFDPAPDPEQQVLTVDRQRRLQAVLRALPEQDRLCVLLRAEGLRYREISEVLEMSLGAVAASLARSLERLSRAGER